MTCMTVECTATAVNAARCSQQLSIIALTIWVATEGMLSALDAGTSFAASHAA